MPAWLIPALKSVLPHVGTIISAAAPVFTQKNADAAANQAMLLQQQITELQLAASENDAHIKALATQLQNALTVFEQGMSLTAKRQQRLFMLCIVTLLISITAISAVLYFS